MPVQPSLPLQFRNASELDPIAEELRGFLTDLAHPTLIEVPGRDRTRLRVVTTLLHGNEASGALAIHAYLRSQRIPETDVLFYLASIDAALADGGFVHRALPGVRDANRAFFGPFDDVPGARAQALIDALSRRPIEALLDLHNNTGDNPPYGVGFGLDRARLNLTAIFGDHYMHSDLRMGTIIEWAQGCCPAVTIECGRTNDPLSDATALAGLERFLVIDNLELEAPPPRHIRVLSQPVRVKVVHGLGLAIGDAADPGAGVTLRNDLDAFNFKVMAAGTQIGWTVPGGALPVVANCSKDRDVTRDYFAVVGDQVVTKRPFIPVMITLNVEVGMSDCLFYAMSPNVDAAA